MITYIRIDCYISSKMSSRSPKFRTCASETWLALQTSFWALEIVPRCTKTVARCFIKFKISGLTLSKSCQDSANHAMIYKLVATPYSGSKIVPRWKRLCHDIVNSKQYNSLFSLPPSCLKTLRTKLKIKISDKEKTSYDNMSTPLATIIEPFVSFKCPPSTSSHNFHSIT